VTTGGAGYAFQNSAAISGPPRSQCKASSGAKTVTWMASTVTVDIDIPQSYHPTVSVFVPSPDEYAIAGRQQEADKGTGELHDLGVRDRSDTSEEMN